MTVKIQSPKLLSNRALVSLGAVSIAVKPSDLTAFLPKSMMTSLTEIPASLYLYNTRLGISVSSPKPSKLLISSAEVKLLPPL